MPGLAAFDQQIDIDGSTLLSGFFEAKYLFDSCPLLTIKDDGCRFHGIAFIAGSVDHIDLIDQCIERELFRRSAWRLAVGIGTTSSVDR